MNSWLWNSFQEYSECVHPVEHSSEWTMKESLHSTAYDNCRDMFSAVDELYEAASDTEKLLAPYATQVPANDSRVPDLVESICTFTREGEHLLAYCRPLAFTEGGEGFISRKDVSEHIQRYVEEERIGFEADRLRKAVSSLLDEFDRLTQGYQKLLLAGLNLPPELQSEFISARNLFSLGFEEAGVMYAGRGLEGVARRIARVHNITLKSGKPASEARFVELLQRLQELRLASNQELLLDAASGNLLHYGRNMRNQVAHPAVGSKKHAYREQAILMAHKAQELWARCSAPGIKLV